MAHTNRLRRQAGYGYPPSPQVFSNEDTAGMGQAWPALSEETPSIEQMNHPMWHGVYPPIYSTIPVGGSSQEPFYIPPVQTTTLSGLEGWASPSTPHPNPTPFNLSPPPVPATPNSLVPNRLHVPANPPDYTWLPQRQYGLTAHHFTPAQPILFNVNFGEPGIRLSAALSRKFTHLRDRDDLVFESSRSPTITMRLEWPGYMSWSRQVRILDSRSVRQSISREKLAYEVAKTVQAFAQSQNGRGLDAEGATDRDRVWAVGEGNLDLDDLVLVRVENVSRGSWQPQFLVHRRHRN